MLQTGMGVQLSQGLELRWAQPLKSAVKLLHLVGLLIYTIYMNCTACHGLSLQSLTHSTPADPIVMHHVTFNTGQRWSG